MKYLIIGAGPSGLAFANRLLERGEKDFLVLEEENEAGGLCRSVLAGGFPLDRGGGHFLDVRLSGFWIFCLASCPKTNGISMTGIPVSK